MLPLLANATEKRMMVCAPHADDEVLGAGGLIARAAANGWEVHVSYATISGYHSAFRNESIETSTRVSEVTEALKVLGCAGFESMFLGSDVHLRLDKVAQAEVIAFLERRLQAIRPSIALLPCHGHYHQDHRAFAEAAIAALRPAPNGYRPLVPLVLAYGHAHGGWGGDPYGFHPSLFVDIEDYLEVKLAALCCYGSQVCPEPHARSVAMVRDQCAAWGAYAGVRYAEPYECLRYLLA